MRRSNPAWTSLRRSSRGSRLLRLLESLGGGVEPAVDQGDDALAKVDVVGGLVPRRLGRPWSSPLASAVVAANRVLRGLLEIELRLQHQIDHCHVRLPAPRAGGRLLDELLPPVDRLRRAVQAHVALADAEARGVAPLILRIRRPDLGEELARLDELLSARSFSASL